MLEQLTKYGFGGTVEMPHERALELVREALAEQGFGVLTEIDISRTLANRLGVQYRPYTILGACNPPLAHRALEAEPEIGMLLPCNVVVYEADDEGRTVVAAMDPSAAMSLATSGELAGIAAEVRGRLSAALDSVVQAGAAADVA